MLTITASNEGSAMVGDKDIVASNLDFMSLS